MQQELSDRPKPLKIIFALPGRSFSNSFLGAWSDLLKWCIYNNISPMMCNKYTSNVYFVRNMCLGGDVKRGVDQLPYDGKIDYDYIMWIDSDIVFSIDNFKRLLSHKQNIVSGLYLMQCGKNYATVVEWNKKKYVKQGYFDFLSIYQNNEYKKQDCLVKVEYTGFGFMLVKKGVFESLKYPWFRPIWENFGDGIKEFASEDVGWCKTICEKGYQILIDPNVILGHEKNVILHPSIFETRSLDNSSIIKAIESKTGKKSVVANKAKEEVREVNKKESSEQKDELITQGGKKKRRKKKNRNKR